MQKLPQEKIDKIIASFVERDELLRCAKEYRKLADEYYSKAKKLSGRKIAKKLGHDPQTIYRHHWRYIDEKRREK